MHRVRLSRLAAAVATAAGAALLGWSLGGVAAVDGELRAASAPAPARTLIAGHHHGDCPRPHRDAEL